MRILLQAEAGIAWEPQEGRIAAKDAAEVEVILSSLATSMAELRDRMGPLLKEVVCNNNVKIFIWCNAARGQISGRRCCLQVNEGGLLTHEGLSFLEVKNLLLLHYCINLLFYLLLKSEGKAVQQHPVLSRLLELRLFMDRIRPLDKKLRYQVDKLLTGHRLSQVSTHPWKEDLVSTTYARPYKVAVQRPAYSKITLLIAYHCKHAGKQRGQPSAS